MITIQNISKSPITILTVHQGSFSINPGEICKINGDKLTKSMLIYQKKRLIKIEVNDLDVSNHIDEKFDFIDENQDFKEESLPEEEVISDKESDETTQYLDSTEPIEIEKELDEITDIEYLKKRLYEAIKVNESKNIAEEDKKEETENTRKLSKEDKEYIRKNYKKMGPKKLSEKLNRNIRTITYQATAMGLTNPKK